jgi:hypothetical protein
MVSLRRIVPSILVLTFALWVPSASSGELAKWDQGRVTALAVELTTTCDALYASFLKEPESGVQSGQMKNYYRLRQVVRRVRDEARQLSSSLGQGEGYEQTLPIYENLMVIVRDAREISERIFTSSLVQEKAEAAGDVLERIAPYYDPKALEEG